MDMPSSCVTVSDNIPEHIFSHVLSKVFALITRFINLKTGSVSELPLRI